MDKSIKSCLLGLLNLNAPGIDCDLSIGGDGTEYKAQFFKHVGECCEHHLPCDPSVVVAVGDQIAARLRSHVAIDEC
eukprot:scaffold79591_cov21-Tisochrysis_lutea.AAC.1